MNEETKQLIDEMVEAIKALMAHHYTWVERNAAHAKGKVVLAKLEDMRKEPSPQ